MAQDFVGDLGVPPGGRPDHVPSPTPLPPFTASVRPCGCTSGDEAGGWHENRSAGCVALEIEAWVRMRENFPAMMRDRFGIVSPASSGEDLS